MLQQNSVERLMNEESIIALLLLAAEMDRKSLC